MILHWVGFALLLVIGFTLFIGGLLNLLGSGDRTGPEFKVSNIVQVLIGLALFIGAFFLK
jgi:hypothetical protein